MAARRGAAKKEACASQPQHAMSCATPETDAATIIRATKECVERIGPDLRYYTSAIAVDALLPFDKPQLPRFIHLLATGKATAAAAIVKPYLPAPSAPQLAYMLVIQCSEPWAMRRPAVAQRLAAGTFYEPLARMEIASTAAMCKAMIHGYEPAAAGMRAHSTVPVLFLQGNEDPTDPPSAVAHARRELPNSRVVVFPYSGHGQIGYACAQFLATRFFEGDGLQKLDTTCASSAALAPFDTRR